MNNKHKMEHDTFTDTDIDHPNLQNNWIYFILYITTCILLLQTLVILTIDNQNEKNQYNL